VLGSLANAGLQFGVDEVVQSQAVGVGRPGQPQDIVAEPASLQSHGVGESDGLGLLLGGIAEFLDAGKIGPSAALLGAGYFQRAIGASRQGVVNPVLQDGDDLVELLQVSTRARTSWQSQRLVTGR